MQKPIKAIVIAGPTASGKSALAMAVAEHFDGVVINADSQQCYRDLAILSARPTPADEARVPHRLFGELDATARDSAAAWAARAAHAIEETAAQGNLPVIVGGTGLYLQALMQGLPRMPAIPPDIRAAAKARLAELGHADFHAALAKIDPQAAARIRPGDTQRIVRAWEIHAATGRPLSAWQADAPVRPVEARYFSILLLPPRAVLTAAIRLRVERMLAAGAKAEVAALLDTGVGVGAPVMRVLGARILADLAQDRLTRNEAPERIVIATRQYAKRQGTWFRHQFRADISLKTKFSETKLPEIFPKIGDFLLT
jgi:tRNA dimethylallyltransferase